jgi:aspartate-semialdehyde dehydrogenase
MQIAVLGASGLVGRACIDELSLRGVDVIPLHRDEAIQASADGLIVAAPVKMCDFNGPLVDCSGSLKTTFLSLPPILETDEKHKRVPNCMASLIAQALAPLHKECTITSILGTTMQASSGAGWRGVQALKQSDTTKIFSGELAHNVLPHEQYEQEEAAINSDLFKLFGCSVMTTSFRVPVFVGHLASLRVETKEQALPKHLVESISFDPRSMENKREVAIGRVRINKKTTDLVICGDQLLCGTAIPAVNLILSA